MLPSAWGSCQSRVWRGLGFCSLTPCVERLFPYFKPIHLGQNGAILIYCYLCCISKIWYISTQGCQLLTKNLYLSDIFHLGPYFEPRRLVYKLPNEPIYFGLVFCVLVGCVRLSAFATPRCWAVLVGLLFFSMQIGMIIFP